MQTPASVCCASARIVEAQQDEAPSLNANVTRSAPGLPSTLSWWWELSKYIFYERITVQELKIGRRAAGTETRYDSCQLSCRQIVLASI